MNSTEPHGNAATGTETVTVVVPVFNGRDYLDECVASIVSQSYTRLDIVLVDDGSTDGSSELCDDWTRRDRRVRTLHTANGGLSRARNAGVDVARGTYITFVDADDVVGPEHVAHMHRVAREQAVELVAVGHVAFDDSTSPEFRNGTTVRTMSPDQALLDVVRRGRGFSSWGKLIASSTFQDLRFRDGVDFEDLELFPRLLVGTRTHVAVSDAETYGYRQHERSLMGAHRRLLKSSLLEVLTWNIDIAEDRHGRGTSAANQLVTAYVMHALRVLEQASEVPVTRERGYDGQLRQLIARHLRTVLRSDDLGGFYKAGVVVALISPDAFIVGFRTAKRLKRSVAPRLRRRP